MSKLNKYQTFVFAEGYDSPLNGGHLPKMEGYGISGWEDGNVLNDRDDAMRLLFEIADGEFFEDEIVVKVKEFVRNKCRP